jgi:hypothetical protein
MSEFSKNSESRKKYLIFISFVTETIVPFAKQEEFNHKRGHDCYHLYATQNLGESEDRMRRRA